MEFDVDVEMDEDSSATTTLKVSAKFDDVVVFDAEEEDLVRGVASRNVRKRFSFKIPTDVFNSIGVNNKKMVSGSVSAVVTRAGVSETVVKPIPLSLSPRLILNVYPESGGSLVCSLPQRLYFQALDESTSDPLDFRLEIRSMKDSAGGAFDTIKRLKEASELLQSVKSLHEGRGVSSPLVISSSLSASRTFILITSPGGGDDDHEELEQSTAEEEEERKRQHAIYKLIRGKVAVKVHPLPPTLCDSSAPCVVLTSAQPSFSSFEPIVIDVGAAFLKSNNKGAMSLGLFKREKRLAAVKLPAVFERFTATFPVSAIEAGGIGEGVSSRHR